MAGVEVRDPQTYQLLLTQQCDTLPDRFARQGYRSLALMPGLRHAWPEGTFYGFEQIYDARALAYQGPEFGWWRIPDQYALARLDQLEIATAPRPPLFVFYPTISSHLPFRPTPPYQANWARMLTQRPFESRTLEASLARAPDWTNLGPAYTDALSYSFTWLAGYLEQHATADLVMIVLGDHQPPATVSGADAPWEVPVHVITHRAEVLAPLRAAGLQPGLKPERPALGRMHELTALLLHALDSAQKPSPQVSR
jgi:phosphoglycerol transferase MdoB-like AlkP superfamily enzyme